MVRVNRNDLCLKSKHGEWQIGFIIQELMNGGRTLLGKLVVIHAQPDICLETEHKR